MKIGVDVGGTKVRVGLVSDDGKIIDKKTAPCPSASPKQEVVDFIAGMVEEFYSDKIESIGIGVPAIVDESGVIRECVNIPSWDFVDIRSDFEHRFGVPVNVRNDCNCYALGVKSSHARTYDNIVCITLGTGVGSGIIIDGKLYQGEKSCAGEIGEVLYKDRNYEFYCSSNFFISKGSTGKDAADAAGQDDPAALTLWEEFGRNIGDLISLVTLCYSPEAIFIGGSISAAFSYFEQSMREKLKNFPYKSVIDTLDIRAVDDPDMLLLGAAY
ncbi:MAG: ROK family protein [Bacteroidales bacterium]|nr:ROK family protein [Bacteroidales bacterium]